MKVNKINNQILICFRSASRETVRLYQTTFFIL